MIAGFHESLLISTPVNTNHCGVGGGPSVGRLLPLISMARCATRWRTSALCCVAALNIVFLVFLHTQRPSADVSPVEPNIDDDDERRDSDKLSLDRVRRLAATKSHKLRRSSGNYGRSMSSVDGYFCGNLTRHSVGIPSSAEMTKETFQWQTVGRGLRETFVFSAYYDDRPFHAVVRIIGISSGNYMGVVYMQQERQTKYCQLWLANEVHPKLTLAEYSIVPETHDRSYAASMYTCSLEKLQGAMPPYAVSLVNEECQPPSNVLRVLNNNDDLQLPNVNFTVCVTPLNFNYDNYHQLVEMVEINRLFGAQRFVFYNYSIGSRVEPYLRWYEQRTSSGGVAALHVIPWRLPVVVDVWPQDPKVEPEIHYFGQLAALNDCLFRNMLSSRFVVFSDLDELIVPRRDDTWLEMVNSITSTPATHHPHQHRSSVRRLLPTPGAFLFANVFFRTDWNSRPSGGASHSHLAERLKLNSLLKTTREDRIYQFYVRSKYIVIAKAVTMVGVHNVLSFIDDFNLDHVMVDEDEALLHHYRQRVDDDVDVTPVADDRMQHFATRIISAVDYVHRHVSDALAKSL